MCLQCGNIACGDDRGQGGHAKLHFKTPHSDCHSVAVQMTGNLEKAWYVDTKYIAFRKGNLKILLYSAI